MKNRLFLFGLLCVIVAACGNPNASFQDIPSQQWQTENRLIFSVTPDDLGSKDVILFVRHTDDYPFQNLWLKVSCQPKDTTPQFERIQLTLAQPDGKWLGKKRGAIYLLDSTLANLSCPADTCEIIIEQNMRANPLEGVQSVGIGLYQK